MIAKGNTHDSGPKLVAYILTAQEGERVEIGGARGFGFFSADLMQAAAIMQQIADHTTNCRDAWFHTQTRLAPGEQLDRAQWERVLDREEKRLGFSGHARAWSFHIDEATGEKHLHAAWFRIDPETNRGHDPGLFKLRLMEVARWAEKEFGLRELSNERQPHDRARAPERGEMEESRRLGTDVRAIRTAILDCFEHADGGKAFKAALEERGLMLANGDRRDCFVVVDQAGGQHALNKKLTGQTLAETRARLADLDRGQLPGVEQAQAMQCARQAEAQPEPAVITIHEPANQIAQPPPPMPERITRPEEWLARGRYDELRAEHQKAQATAAETASPAEPTPPGMETAEPAADQVAAQDSNNGLLRSFGTWLGKFIDRLTERLAPALTPDEVVREARADDQVQQQASDEAERQKQVFEDWREQRRQEEQEADPRLAAMMQLHMQPSARRQNELYRETERDRE